MVQTAQNERVDDLRLFPSTRYQGSKRKIVPWIYECLLPLDFNSALDVFGGTASVSYLFKRMGKDVTYNDKLRFNYLIGTALIENQRSNLSAESVRFLLAPIKKEASGVVSETFPEFYFTTAENRQIDSICERIARIHPGTAGRFERAIAYYALFQTCLVKRPFNLFHRRNLYIRLSHVERSFGNKITWDRSIRSHFVDFIDEANSCVFKGKGFCTAINYDALNIPDKTYDLVYIDPPYLSQIPNETSNYMRCYHFLEGLANYENWPRMIDYSTTTRRLQENDQNPWINEASNGDAFDKLFDKFRASILVISYKKFGVPSIATLLRLLKRHNRKPRIHTRHYMYALNHQNGNAALNREALIIAE